jgi:hypothetical protein
MARIVILEHEQQGGLGIVYLAHLFAQRWRARGHAVAIHRGLATPPPGDLAVLHPDLTVVPAAYAALAARYPRAINARALDGSKGRYSVLGLGRHDAWAGPVIAKTEANYGGKIEYALRRLRQQAGMAPDVPAGPVLAEYPVFGSLREVPAQTWTTPGLRVEKFVPERDADGYYVRIWTFLGDRERSNRYRSQSPMVKAGTYDGHESVAVPAELRELRTRLGYDYGKFDYIRHGDGFALLDANRTPGLTARLVQDPGIRAGLEGLADGVDAFL